MSKELIGFVLFNCKGVGVASNPFAAGEITSRMDRVRAHPSRSRVQTVQL